jgi:hypothetical protein
MRATHIVTAVFALGVAACSQGGSQNPGAASQPAASAAGGSQAGLSAAQREDVDADGVVRRGDALSAAPALTVADVFAQAEALNGKVVKVSGEVSKVCQKSGCWFILRDGEQSIRITSKGYKYFVPSTAPGMQGVVEGDLSVKVLDVKTAQHFADDEAEATGKPAATVEAPVKEIAVASVGLELRKPN